jgi:hypothetical protein
MTGAILLAIAVVLVVAGYVLACWWWPFVACKRCDGTGKRRSWWGGSFRLCRRCKGTARRLRTGRRVFNWLRVLHDEGQA